MNIIVIGGGPAGIMAAGTAAKSGADVILLEKNAKLGKKLYITGKGRCNITNNCDNDTFIKNVVTNPRFLYSSIKSFSPENTMEFFENAGCRLKTERGGRVFPESDKSSDILSAFQHFISGSGVKLILNCKCNDIKYFDGKFSVYTDKGVLTADKLIIASGGVSYSATGSTGELFKLIETLGHKIIPLKAALCPLIIKEDFVKELAGLSLKNVNVSAVHGGKVIYSEFGEMLFTHNGVSGPVILSMSSFINKYEAENIKVIIDLKPALDEKILYNRINRDFLAAKNKNFKNSLNELLPKSLIPVIIKLSGIDEEKQTNSVTAEERKRLVKLLKNFTLTVKSLDDIESAIITSGGVSVGEINPSSMESKIISGLYFAGEVIDVDALTGGFNIQIALSTGYIAGKNASKTVGADK